MRDKCSKCGAKRTDGIVLSPVSYNGEVVLMCSRCAFTIYQEVIDAGKHDSQRRG